MKRSFLTMLTAIIFINTAVNHLVSVTSISIKQASLLFISIRPVYLDKYKITAKLSLAFLNACSYTIVTNECSEE